MLDFWLLCSIGAPSRLWWQGIRPFFDIFDLKIVFLIEFHIGIDPDLSIATLVWLKKMVSMRKRGYPANPR